LSALSPDEFWGTSRPPIRCYPSTITSTALSQFLEAWLFINTGIIRQAQGSITSKTVTLTELKLLSSRPIQKIIKELLIFFSISHVVEVINIQSETLFSIWSKDQSTATWMLGPVMTSQPIPSPPPTRKIGWICIMFIWIWHWDRCFILWISGRKAGDSRSIKKERRLWRVLYSMRWKGLIRIQIDNWWWPLTKA